MSLEEDLKKVIPASKEDIRIVEASKRRPLPPPEEIERQLRASGAYCDKLPSEIDKEREREHEKRKQ